MGAAMRKMFEKRRAMNVLILGTPVDKKAVRQLSMQIGELEGEIALMRADLIASIQPPLSKAQIEKLTQPPRRPQSRPPQAQPSRAAKTQPPRPEGEKESLEDLIRRGEREENERPRRFDRPSSRPGRDRKQEK